MTERAPAESTQPELRTASSWTEIVEAIRDLFDADVWAFRGHDRYSWKLETTLEREFGLSGVLLERDILRQFIRMAPRWLSSHLVPRDHDTASWLGLIQHYGGPTRLLDATRSPYVALFFAFEAAGDHDRALWAINSPWCQVECARLMASEPGPTQHHKMMARLLFAQDRLVHCLVAGDRPEDDLFRSFQTFAGIFPLEVWKPDPRQSAQQAMFLCMANPEIGFTKNLAQHRSEPRSLATIHKLRLRGSMRKEALQQLARMNITAATLIPDLSGLARSLRTHLIRQHPQV
jgi:hypothetical protein